MVAEVPARTHGAAGGGARERVERRGRAALASGAATAGPPAAAERGRRGTVQGTQLMRSAAEGDSALLLGGDLIVTVHCARGLARAAAHVTHPFARVRVGGQSQLTTVRLAEPGAGVGGGAAVPGHQRGRGAAGRGLGRGRRRATRSSCSAWPPTRRAWSPTRRFLGRVEVPLSESSCASMRPRLRVDSLLSCAVRSAALSHATRHQGSVRIVL